MLKATAPIGVMDSGIGGLTVVRQLQRLLPGEDIIFFGDSANCPYGNRTADDICNLSLAMLRFLEGRGVKCVAIACNTISTMVDRLRPHMPFRVESIVECGAAKAVEREMSTVGIIGTEFTVKSGAYDRLIHQGDPDCVVVSKGSPKLAALVDRGDFNQEEIDEEIRTQVGDILSRGAVKDLILGCTHYPIVEENFRRCFPQLNLIDPAYEQASAVKAYLTKENALNAQEKGSFRIFTSGDPAVYVQVVKRLGLFEPDEITHVG